VGILQDLFFDYTLRTVALGAGALGIVSGAVGAFAVLRRQSMLGDAIAHAALPGIALAFLLTGSKSTLVLVVGAAIAGWLGTLVVIGVVSHSRIPEDSALGLVLSVFFGFGLVVLTFVQRLPTAAQAGLDTFLFGQAATLLERDVFVIAGLGALALGIVAAFWKEFKLLAFDREFGASIGFPMRLVEVLLTSTLVLAIVVGLQTVGVVLMSAMIVAPAAAARQWTDSLGVMVLLSALIGALAGVTGAVISGVAENVPTGPMIVLSVTTLVLASLLLAPHRGLLWSWLRQQRNRREIRADTVLADLYALDRQHLGVEHGHAVAVLEAMGGGVAVRRTLAALEERGLAVRTAGGAWQLTPQGRTQAESVLQRNGEP
jgi:manganese/zinc/iron transport system permease protein